MILITGAAGHIGKRLARRFLKEGVEFIGIDVADNFELPDYRFVKLDIRDPAIEQLIQNNGVNAIIHLALCTKPKMDPKLRDDIDLNGSRNIAECAVRKGVKKFVFASSGRVYGDKNKPGGTHDCDGNYLNPGEDEYAVNKAKVEEMLLAMEHEHALKLAILRLGIVCWEGGGAGFGDMLRATAKSGRFFVLAGKNPPIQLVHVEDVIDACRNAIGKEGIYDVTSAGTMTIYDLFAGAAKLGGAKPSCIRLWEKSTVFLMTLLWKVGMIPVPPLYIKMYGYDITRDITKTAAMLGRPQYTIEQILKGVIQGTDSYL
jgi:UDP-glucose 4-epimerase